MSGHPTVWQEDYQSKVRDLHQAKARIRTLEAELAEYKEAVRVLGKSVADVRSDADWPSLTNTMVAGLFCGVEDRDLRDRYDGARYGYEDALDRCHEFIQNATADALNNPIAKAAIEGSEP